MPEREDLKLYYDYKSPFAYLALEPALALPGRFAVRVRWRPFVLRIKGRGERSIYSEWKARYSYMDARRFANRRGGFKIKGPPKVYDSRPALIGGLLAEERGFFADYSRVVFSRFFERTLEIDEPEQVAAVLAEFGVEPADYHAWREGEGALRLEASVEEGHEDHVFGVPIFHFRGELFWGHDRIPLLEECLAEAGLALTD